MQEYKRLAKDYDRQNEWLQQRTQEYSGLLEDYKELKQRHNRVFQDFEWLKQECEELKRQKAILKSWSKHLEQWKDNLLKDNDYYFKTLEEIEECCKEQNLKYDTTACMILDIINKVKDKYND